MTNGWNFQGWIALPLETYLRGNAFKATYSADEISCGKFVEAMYMVLEDLRLSLQQISDFIIKCKPYEGKTAREIPDETANELFEEFQTLIGKRLN